MNKNIRVVELFAGVGGFRLGLEKASPRYKTVMANQWEPAKKKQVAGECYAYNFDYQPVNDNKEEYHKGESILWIRDINELTDEMKQGNKNVVPEHDLLVGGFPCFIKGTKVLTNRGEKNIEDVNIGDVVLTHTNQWQKVLKTFKNPLNDRKMLEISTNTGRKVIATENHPFYVIDIDGDMNNNIWKPASELVAEKYLVYTMGEFLLDGWEVIEDINKYENAEEYVYNLEVEGDNSYTANGIAVHNCQDYSVAKPNTQSHGLQGKKGVLWWNIYDILKEKRPKAVFLENVDRLLKSPSKQRGRDFAVILSTMSDLGYTVEWQVVNAADYGFPQRRRRVFIVGLLEDNTLLEDKFKKGIIGETLPFVYENMAKGDIEGNPWEITENFNKDGGDSPFANRGVLRGREYITGTVKSTYNGKKTVLGELLEPLSDVPDDFITDPARWKYTKGAKDEERIKSDGFRYRYKEGAVPFPDALDKPARTILTSEGGSSPSRTTHCILQDGKYRRLTPKELERLNGFPDDWTKNMNQEEKITNTMRGFLMGNALVIGIIEKIGEALEKKL